MTRVSPLLAALLLALGLALVAPVASAQRVSGTPDNPIAAPANAEELELQKALTWGRIGGRISIPDDRAASLIQPAGQTWREFHTKVLTWIGAIAVLGMLGIVTLYYLTHGRIRIDAGPSGHTVQRFNLLDRLAHWMTAVAFMVLGLTGLNITFGRFLLLPLMGPEAFHEWSAWAKLVHNFLSFPFTLGLVLMLLLWAKDNIPNKVDLAWFKAAGGLFSRGQHPEAGRFNGGQKFVFWTTIGAGALVAFSGYVLIFPFAITDIAGMQLASVVHGVIAVLMVAALTAHVYIGTIGMEGAFAAMGSGQVDINWAREHHSLWLEEELARAEAIARQGTEARPASAD